MIELLAPAGDEKSFFAAVNNGADAVYLGLSDFSARKNAQNFNFDNINYYVSYAHTLGVKVYVAVNTLVKNSEIDNFLNTVAVGYSVGVDAFILQDVFLANLLKVNFPDIVLHLSTQAGVNNVYGAQMAKDMGFSRVILARETNLTEIEKITRIIETETFAHGALCTCFSGHCYMSSYVGGNSGNRGFCKQPCRKSYCLEGKQGGDYPISLSDLNLVSEISKLKDAGVASVKIEGRMRSAEYVAAAVSLYRKAIDGDRYNLSDIKRTFNRGNYTKGYLYGVDQNIISDKVQNHLGERVGVVKTIKGDCLTLSPNRYNLKGDAFKIISNGQEVGNAVCLKDGDVLNFKGKVKIGDVVSITKDSSISERLLATTKKIKLNVLLKVEVGQKMSISANGIELFSEQEIPQANSKATSVEELKNNLLKTDKYPFDVQPEVVVKGEPFIVKSVLNNLRSSLYKKIFMQNVKSLKNAYIIEENACFYGLNYKDIVLADKFVKVPNDSAFVLRPDDYSCVDKIAKTVSLVNCDKYLFIPAFLTEKDCCEIEKLIGFFDGVYADGLCGIVLAKRYNKKLIVGLGGNIFNNIDVKKLKEITDDVVLSQELSFKELDGFCNNSGYVFTFGSIRLMELTYCPFGRNCKECKRDKNKFILTDEMGRKFTLIRYKIGGSCRFEVYNEQILYTQVKNNNLYNFIGLDEKIIENIYRNKNKQAMTTFSITVGNTKRGVF